MSAVRSSAGATVLAGEVFEGDGQAGCKRLKAVVMDMNASYEEEIKEHAPHAKIIYDSFHVIAKYSREVIDRSG